MQIYFKKYFTFVKTLNNLKMIRTEKRAYPGGKVPKDFKNWFKKIKASQMKEGSIKKVLNERAVKYVESFPFRKSVEYKIEIIKNLDVNGNITKQIKTIRLV